MSHNSTEGELRQSELNFKLTGSQAKTAYAIEQNCERMIKECGLASIVFMTLTVGDKEAGQPFRQVWNSKEASRRFNSLNSHVLRKLFERAVVVTERHKSGAIHFHLLGVLAGRPDVRTGFEFETFRYARRMRNFGRRNVRAEIRYKRAASHALRGIWATLLRQLPSYGFGRAETTPVEKTGRAIARYVSKYLRKNVEQRLACDHRKKLVRYLGWSRAQLKPNEFSWASKRATSWRIKTRQLAALVGIGAREQMTPIYGPRWAFKVSRIMNAVQDDCAPGFAWGWPEMQAARVLMLRDGRHREISAINGVRHGDAEARFLHRSRQKLIVLK